MSLQTSFRSPSARLGTHYAIFVSGFASLVLLLLILEQLGARKVLLSHFMIVPPLIVYVGLAMATRTLDAAEFFVVNRRVPYVFNGLAMASATIGGVGYFSVTGTAYLIGFDALAIFLGMAGGFVFATILIVPFLRKVGAYTLPGYLRDRFGLPILGYVAALLLIPPAMLLLVAELSIGAFIAQLFASVSFESALTLGAIIIIVITGAGGMRSLTWVQCAQYFVALAGFLAPVVIISVLVTNLPLPQFTLGELYERVSTLERAIGVVAGQQMPLSIALPGKLPIAAPKPFFEAFGVIHPMTFAALLFSVLAGTAVMPSLLMRAGTAPSVFESRRSMGWGALFLGIFLISAPAYAAFAKYLTLQDLVGALPSQLPNWIDGLREAGLANIGDLDGDGVVAASEILVARDGATLALPILGELPFVLVVVIATAGIAATLAAACAHASAIGLTIGEDLFHRGIRPSASPGRRLLASRVAIAGTTILAAWFVAFLEFDPLRTAILAFSLAASAYLPVLVLSIWWKGTSGIGALAGMLAGFGIAATLIVLAELGNDSTFLGLSSLLAAVIGVPIGFAVTIGVSLMFGAPSEAHSRLVDTIRDPSGDALYDRLGHALLDERASNNTTDADFKEPEDANPQRAT